MTIKQVISLAAIALTLAACTTGTPAQPGASTAPSDVGANPTTGTPGGATFVPARVTPKEAYERIQAGEQMVVLDVRTAAAFNAERIKDAVNIPWANLREKYSQLPKDRFILLYCT